MEQGAAGAQSIAKAQPGAWDGPTLPLRLASVASGQVRAVLPVPAKCIAEYEGARMIVLQVPGSSAADLEAMARTLAEVYGPLGTHTLFVPVERLEDLQEYRFEVPLPSADDPAAVEWFAERRHMAWMKQEQARGFADHPFIGKEMYGGSDEYGFYPDTGQRCIVCGHCGRPLTQHHASMRPYAKLGDPVKELGRAAARGFLRELAEWPGAAHDNDSGGRDGA